MSAARSPKADEVAVLLFTIGLHRYGADASQILRVDLPDAETHRESPLGRPERGQRALYFQAGEFPSVGGAECAERSLAIDEVLELRQVAVTELRRKTFVLASAKAALGFWLDGNQPVVLVDLPGAVPSSIPPK